MPELRVLIPGELFGKTRGCEPETGWLKLRGLGWVLRRLNWVACNWRRCALVSGNQGESRVSTTWGRRDLF